MSDPADEGAERLVQELGAAEAMARARRAGAEAMRARIIGVIQASADERQDKRDQQRRANIRYWYDGQRQMLLAIIQNIRVMRIP
jgi:hypothetical protein